MNLATDIDLYVTPHTKVLYPAGTPVEFARLEDIRDKDERSAFRRILRTEDERGNNPAIVKLDGRFVVLERRFITGNNQ